MRLNRSFLVAVVAGLALVLVTGTFARSQQVVKLSGDKLTNDDGPFEVNGLTEDFGWLLVAADRRTLEEAVAKAQSWLNARRTNLRAEIVAADGKRKAYLSRDDAPAKKKEIKAAEKKIPDFIPKKFVDFDPNKEKAYKSPEKPGNLVINDKAFVGKWTGNGVRNPMVITADGKCYNLSPEGNVFGASTWKRDGNKLIRTFSDGNGVLSGVVTTYALDGSHLVGEFRGEVTIYSKINE